MTRVLAGWHLTVTGLEGWIKHFTELRILPRKATTGLGRVADSCGSAVT